MNTSCGLYEWECALLRVNDGDDCYTHRRAIAQARREMEENRRNDERQAIIAKYDRALKALDEHPMTVVESTYRGLLGEFYREMKATEK